MFERLGELVRAMAELGGGTHEQCAVRSMLQHNIKAAELDGSQRVRGRTGQRFTRLIHMCGRLQSE
jgi:hypothetical protein